MRTQSVLLLSILLLLPGPLLLGQTAVDQFRAYYGMVVQKRSDGSPGKPLAGVEVEFSDQAQGYNIRVRTNAAGRYYTELPKGNFKVRSIAPNSLIIAQQPGAGKQGYQQRIEVSTREVQVPVFMPPKRERHGYPMNGPYPYNTGGVPDVELICSRDTVVVGETFGITVKAKDNTGLHSIWWYATMSKERELSRKHIFECAGVKQQEHSWEVSISKPGLVVLTADARDVEYEEAYAKHNHQTSLAMQTPEVHILAVGPGIE